MKKIYTLLFFTLLSGGIFAQLEPGITKKVVWIESEPAGAQVFLLEKGEWRTLGVTPLTVKIRIGEKNLKLVKEDYQELILKVNSQKQGRVKAELTLIPVARAVFQSEIADAEVWMDGVRAGKTNKPIEKISLGKKKIEIKKPGYHPVSLEMELSEARLYEIPVQMTVSGPVFTGDPAKDLIGEWELENVGSLISWVGITKPGKMIFYADGTYFRQWTLDGKSDTSRGKYQIDVSSKPWRITQEADQVVVLAGARYTKATGRFDIRNEKLYLITYRVGYAGDLSLEAGKAAAYKKIK